MLTMIKYFIIILLFLYVWAFFVEPNIIVVKKYKRDCFNGKKIVFISDLHIAKGDMHRLKRIVKKINAQNPDLVLSCGDYIKGHNGKTTLSAEKIAKELGNIKAPVVSVLGNHDGWYDKYKVKTALEKNGIKVLMNSNTKVEGIYIAGVEDLQTGIPRPETALEGSESPRILLTHTPDIYYDVKENVDLILAGHVHGGQVRIPFKGALIVPSKFGTKFASGSFKETQNEIIVSKGLGTSILNVRFLTFPEIIVFE